MPAQASSRRHCESAAGIREEDAPMWVTAVEDAENELAEPAHSYVRNCVLIAREGDTPFLKVDERTVLARLDGYAVLPMERYKALLSTPI
jgi:hypothetical protein